MSRTACCLIKHAWIVARWVFSNYHLAKGSVQKTLRIFFKMVLTNEKMSDILLVY